MKKLAIIDLKGDFFQGFSATVKIWSGDLPTADPIAGKEGFLPGNSESLSLYKTWVKAYENHIKIAHQLTQAQDGGNSATFALKEKPKTSHASLKSDERVAYNNCIEVATELLSNFNNWLKYSQFSLIVEELKIHQPQHILIESNNFELRKMPWQKWDLLDSQNFALTEIGLTSPNFKSTNGESPKTSERATYLEGVKILVVLGKDANIESIFEDFQEFECDVTVVRNLPELDVPLWEKYWDILIFNGHSKTEGDGKQGKFQLSDGNWLTISDIKGHFRQAINHNLKVAIFNSCDGLGLAYQLAEGEDLHLPQIIVMQENLPVAVAPIFLKYFFEEFTKGISLYLALRATRDRLKILEKENFPCVSWLPVICQNPTVESTTWNQLKGISGSSTRKETANVQNQLSRREFQNRRALLAQVRSEVWGLLEQSLHHALLINLHKENQPDLVKRSWDVEVKVGNTQKKKAVKSNIIQIFDRGSIAGKLLILGVPGAGKTTTQLELAQELIKRAENDASEPMPVLFNLSSWKNDNQTIAQWLIQELKDKYGVRQKIGKDWLEEQQLLPLLDGLDELASERQKKCVQAINQFMESEQRSLYIVVCSRSEEYELWQTPLNLNGAICLSPLTESQIQEYLASVELSKLWEKIKDYPVILDLIKTPLFLSMMALAYEALSIEEWGSYTTKETCREYLLKVYVERMLKRKIKNLWYPGSKQPNEKNLKYWLHWLSSKLEKDNQTEFLIENMQPHLFLPIKILTWFEYIATQLIFFIILGFFIYLHRNFFFDVIKRFSVRGLIFTIVPLWSARKELIKSGKKFEPGGEFYVKNQEIRLVRGLKFPKKENIYAFAQERIQLLKGYEEFGEIIDDAYINQSTDDLKFLFFWKQLSNFLFVFLWIPFLVLAIIYRTIQNLSISGLINNSIGFLGVVLVANIGYFVAYFLSTKGMDVAKKFRYSHLVQVIKTKIHRFWGLLYGFFQSIKESDIDTIIYPNEGIFQSLFTSLITAIFTGLTIGIIATLLWGFKWGIPLGLIFGTSNGLRWGGRACIQHFVMRLILGFSGNIPWNYARFLNYTTERMLLQRVGGRYRFIHRFLQEYFANMKLN